MTSNTYVQFPNNIFIEVPTQDENEARRLAWEFVNRTPELRNEIAGQLPIRGLLSQLRRSAQDAGLAGTLQGAALYAKRLGWDDIASWLERHGEEFETLPLGETGRPATLRDFPDAPISTLFNFLGQGVGGFLPSIVAGVTGGLGGAAIAGAPGAIAGSLLGAGSAGILMTAADLYKELRDENVPEERAREIATEYGALIGATEVIPAARLANLLIGKGIKKEVADRIVSRIAKEAGKSAVYEGIQEAASDIAQQAVVKKETGRPLDLERTLEAGIIGALGGGALGAGVGAISRPRIQATTTDTQEETVPPPEQPTVVQPTGITTPEEARNFLRTQGFDNILASDLTDEELVTVAQRRAEDFAARQETMDDLRRVRLELGFDDTLTEDRQVANRFFNKLLKLEAAGQINLTEFRFDDIREAILADPESSQQNALIQQAINAAKAAGYLEEYDKGVYRIRTANQNAEVLRDRYGPAYDALREYIEKTSGKEKIPRDVLDNTVAAELSRLDPNPIGEPLTARELAARWVVRHNELPRDEKTLSQNLKLLSTLDPEVAKAYAEYVSALREGNFTKAANVMSFFEGNAENTFVGDEKEKVRADVPVSGAPVAVTDEFGTRKFFEEQAARLHEIEKKQDLIQKAIKENKRVPELDALITEQLEKATPAGKPLTIPGVSPVFQGIARAYAKKHGLTDKYGLPQPKTDELLRQKIDQLPIDRMVTWKMWQDIMAREGVQLSPIEAGLLNQRARDIGILTPSFELKQTPPLPQPQVAPPPVVATGPTLPLMVRTALPSVAKPGQMVNIPKLRAEVSRLMGGKPVRIDDVRRILKEMVDTGRMEKKGDLFYRPAVRRSTVPPTAKFEGFATPAEVQEALGLARDLTGGVVDVQGVPVLTDANGNRLFGDFNAAKSLIRLAIDGIAPEKIQSTAVHEAWHAVEDAGIVPVEAIDALNAARPALEQTILRTMPEYDAAYLKRLPDSEIRALAAEAYFIKSRNVPKGLRGIFQKFRDLIKRFTEALRRQPSVENIYRKLLNGEYGKKMAAGEFNVSGGEKYSGMPQTETPDFKRWFGNSKVKDADGRPLRVYHTTFLRNKVQPQEKVFDSFNTLLGYGSLGTHFGTANAANDIVKYRSISISFGDVRPVTLTGYIRIENPYTMHDAGDWTPEVVFNHVAEDINRGIITHPRAREIYQETLQQLERWQKGEFSETFSFIDNPDYFSQLLLTRLGYDGVVYENQHEDPGSTSWIIFDKNQFKSAIGREGPFSDSPNMFASAIPPGYKTPDPGLPAMPTNKDSLTWFEKTFLSPILTIGKLRNGRYRNLAEIQRTVSIKKMEADYIGQDMLAALMHRFPNDTDQRMIVRYMEEASRTGKPPPYDSMPKEMADALKHYYKGMNKLFDMAIEANAKVYFDPDAVDDLGRPKYSEQKQARLRAFWEKYGGMNLLDIPRPVLRAISPEGARAIAEMEKMRNPYYLPMVARGDHFIAVYERKPNGERGKLVRMAIFDKPTITQKLRGIDDERYFRELLQREYGDPKKYIISPTRQLTLDKDAERLDFHLLGEFILRMEEYADDVKALKALEELKKKRDKLSMKAMFRPNNGILMAIHPKNETSYIHDNLMNYVSGLGAYIAKNLTDNAYVRERNKLSSTTDQKYFDDLREYSLTPTESYAGIRALSYQWYMGMALDTAIINTLQSFQITVPRLMSLGDTKALLRILKVNMEIKSSFAEVMKAPRGLRDDPQYLAKKFMERLRDDDERAAVKKAIEMNVFPPLYAIESKGQFTADFFRRLGVADDRAGRLARGANTIWEYSAAFQSSTEALNRIYAFISAYRAAKENPKLIERTNRFENKKLKTPFDFAVDMVDETQFRVTKEDRAYLQRFTPVAEVATQFMSFPMKMAEQYFMQMRNILLGIRQNDPDLAKAGAIQLLLQSQVFVLFGGLFTLPMAGTLRKILEQILLPIFGEERDLEEELRKAIINLTNDEFVARALARGVPYANRFADLSGRTEINPIPFDRLSDPSVFSLLGPTGALLDNYVRAFQNWNEMVARGDWINLSRMLMPRAIGNAATGFFNVVDEQPIRTRQGQVLKDKLTFSEFLTTSIGFPPTDMIDARLQFNRVNEMTERLRRRTERINTELAEYLRQALAADDVTTRHNAYVKFQRRLHEIVREAWEEKNPAERALPNLTAIREQAIRNYLGAANQAVLMKRAPKAVRPEIPEMMEAYR